MMALLAALFAAEWLERWLASGRSRDGTCPGCGDPSPDGLPCQSCTTW
ncbi:MAG TPA: hypothetical protein VH044_08205 [Polyangiaceae bacterium]|nr:hypothetical protein [Polyangiaceae bacterium]